jgi:hypothetical protein
MVLAGRINAAFLLGQAGRVTMREREKTIFTPRTRRTRRVRNRQRHKIIFLFRFAPFAPVA